MSSIQHLQNNKIKAIFWFIFFRQIAHYSGCRLQFDGKLIEAWIWILAQFNSNRVDQFFSWNHNGLGQDKFVILVEESKSHKLRKIQIMENQDSCSSLVENQSHRPDAGKDEQVLVHSLSIGDKNEEVVEENNLTYAEVWALRQKIFQENVKIWIISSKIYMNLFNKLGQ